MLWFSLSPLIARVMAFNEARKRAAWSEGERELSRERSRGGNLDWQLVTHTDSPILGAAEADDEMGELVFIPSTVAWEIMNEFENMCSATVKHLSQEFLLLS